MCRSHGLICAAALLAVALTGCGENPAGPSGAVVLRGTVMGDGSAHAASAGYASGGSSRITITVQENPALTTTAAGNGTFELTGLPEGEFTLVFSVNGATIGTITISGVQAGQTITITVQVTGGTVVLVDQETEPGDDDQGDSGDRTCAIAGGKPGQPIELEGNVKGTPAQNDFKLRVKGNRVKNSDGLVDVTLSGATFKCNGKPGTTCDATRLKEGSQVHVSGTLTSCDMTTMPVVAARRITIQK